MPVLRDPGLGVPFREGDSASCLIVSSDSLLMTRWISLLNAGVVIVAAALTDHACAYQVYSQGAKSPDLVGVLQVPLALPAMSPHGVLEGQFPLTGPGPTGSHVSVEVQWLPLDCNDVPLPSEKQDPELGCLFIHMDRANDLINADIKSLSDPYAVLKVLHRSHTKSQMSDDSAANPCVLTLFCSLFSISSGP